MTIPDEYQYESAQARWLEAELWPALRAILKETSPTACRAIEIGCGNGATAAMLCQLGYNVVGIDSSESGIRAGIAAYPGPLLRTGSVYDDLACEYGRFPLVISLEVIKHL